MHWIDWIIMLVPFTAVLALAIRTGRYARDVVDYLAAGRVAGRYVIAVGDVAAGLSVISLVGHFEATYRAGSAMGFWSIATMPLGMFLSLSGYCVYRWRATRALSFGQFLEMRYSHSFRIFAATLRNISEMITNAIGPAIAANFFIYFLGVPHKVHVLGLNLPTFAILVAISLTLAMVAIWPAGRISLLVTDTFQGIVSYPIFVLIAGYAYLHFAWGTDIEPVIMDRVPGESFVNPFDVSKLRDFNMFALGVTLMNTILQRASWFGNDTTSAGRTPHEQKMAGVLGTWRNGFAWTMIILVTLVVIAVMNHEKYILPGNPSGFSSHEMRIELLNKIAEEAVPDAGVRAQIAADLAALPPPGHRAVKDPVPEAVREECDAWFAAMAAIARDPRGAPPLPEPSPELAEWLGPNRPLSQLDNLDTPYIDAVRNRINGNIPASFRDEADAVRRGERTPSPELAAIQGSNAKQSQKVRTIYGQMMFPAVVRRILPRGLVGLFALLMVMLLVSTDDSRIFNASSTWVQDVVLPFFKTPPSSRLHITILRWASVAVAVFFFVVAVFFSQLDYIIMFVQIMTALWLGGGGTVMVFGLYSRFGNTVGAWCSLAFGSGFSLLGLVMQRTWAAHVVPWLSHHGWTEGVFRFFARLAAPLNPWVDWSFGLNSGESTFEQALQLFREKFFMNSQEIYGTSMVLSIVAYCLGSWIARRFFGVKPYNLDKLLHRGEYADKEDCSQVRKSATVHRLPRPSLFARLIGIDDEYTRGDKIIAWSVFLYSIGYQFGLAFLAVLLWNTVSPWPGALWGKYYFVTVLIVPIFVGAVSTVWFMWGGIRDGIRLFRDLESRTRDSQDNGFVSRN